MKKKYSKVSTCLAAITSSLVAGAAVTGCIPAVEYGTPHADFSVKTKVIDEEGKAIEGIQVALKSSLGEEPIAVDKTCKGGEALLRDDWPHRGEMKVVATDVDGEEHGRFAADSVSFVVKDKDYGKPRGRWYMGKFYKEVTIKLKPKVKE